VGLAQRSPGAHAEHHGFGEHSLLEHDILAHDVLAHDSTSEHDVLEHSVLEHDGSSEHDGPGEHDDRGRHARLTRSLLEHDTALVARRSALRAYLGAPSAVISGDGREADREAGATMTDVVVGPLTQPTTCPFPVPTHPLDRNRRLEPFLARLLPPRAYCLSPQRVTRIEMRATTARIHPDLPPVAAWGYGLDGRVTSPGPLLEAEQGRTVVIRFDNRLPGSAAPGAPRPGLPFATNIAPDPATGQTDPQNLLGRSGDVVEPTGGAPVGWTSVHLHGGHSRADADGFPNNMAGPGGSQLSAFDNTYDNGDIGLDKVGAFLWYHDHAMNGTRYHVYAGLAGGYLLRDQRERALGLPTTAEDGEVVLLLADRNVTADGEAVRLLHKTTESTAEMFGPLTLVNGVLWPRIELRPEVYRLRLLNASNARAFRLHLVRVEDRDGVLQVSVVHRRILVIGSDGGLLRRASPLDDGDALTMAPSERFDVLVDLSGLEGERLYLVNSAPAPFGGDPIPDLAGLLEHGDGDGLNPYPYVACLDVDRDAPTQGAPAALFRAIAGTELNGGFKRLVHGAAHTPATTGVSDEVSIEGHDHHTILLGESDPPGHLYLHEIVEDPAGTIELQLPEDAAAKRYSVIGWWPADDTPSHTRPSFYDRVGILPLLGQWQVFRFVNATGDTHPLHIHQSQFQPLGDRADRLVVTDANDANLYDPTHRRTAHPLRPDAEAPGRTYEPHEVTGWNDVIRVDPGNVVKVAIRFDVPGSYVYHCHVLEHEDTEMMRPIVVTVTDMSSGMAMMGTGTSGGMAMGAGSPGGMAMGAGSPGGMAMGPGASSAGGGSAVDGTSSTNGPRSG
jgi:spore coat protein A